MTARKASSRKTGRPGKRQAGTLRPGDNGAWPGPNATIRFLADFCRRHPLDEKILVVPSFIAGHQIGHALAREAGSWINLRFVTSASLAQEILEGEGATSVARPMTASAQAALMDKVLRELLAEGKLEYFRGAEDFPGLSRAVFRAVRDLRLDGRTGADLDPKRFLVERKGRELALIMDRYERVLGSEGLLDEAGLLTLAARSSQAGSASRAWLLCSADVRLSRLESDLVRAAAGERLVLVPGDPVFGLERPRLFWPEEGVGVSAPGAGRLSWLFAPGKTPPGTVDVSLDIFRALGPAGECREILRRLYAEKIPFDRVEVLAPPGSPHPAVFHLLAVRTALPVTFGEGLPVSFTSPGRLFFGLADWLESDLAVARLCPLIETGDLALPPGASGGPIPPRSACRHLKSALIGWGRDRYLERLEALRRSREADLELADRHETADAQDNGEERCARIRADILEVESLASAVGRLLGVLPEPDASGKVDIRDLCEALSRIIKDLGRPSSELDRKARETLLARLEEVRAEIPDPTRSWKEALDILRATGSAIRVGASPPLPGHLHVSGLGTGGLSGRPFTFVAGLDEAAFPGRGLQDPVLLDEERSAISGSLPTAADALRSNLYELAAVLASLRGKVTLSYSSFDIIGDRASFPSSVVLQALRLLRGEPDLDYSALEQALPEASGFVPERLDKVFDEIDWWLARLSGRGPAIDGPGSVRANFPALAAGLAAERARESGRVTEFEGLVDISPVRDEIDPVSGRKAVMSATRLELLARCPFGYFLRHVLGIEPPRIVKYDRARWLDPLQRGSLVHDVLCEFMTRVAEAEETVDPVKHGPAMKEIGLRRLGRARREIPPPSEGIYEGESRDILADLEVFLAAEAERDEKVEPLEFEKGFSREEIDLGDGRSFLLRGFIDRIDRTGPGTYRVLDYKTGNPAPFEDLVEFGRGRIIQHALYAVAVEGILARERPGRKPRVTASGYFFPTRRGEGREIMVRDFDRKKFRFLLNDLLGLLEKGIFIAGPEAKCEFCDLAPVCVGGGADLAKRKREADPGVFEAYDKLKEYR